MNPKTTDKTKPISIFVIRSYFARPWFPREKKPGHAKENGHEAVGQIVATDLHVLVTKKVKLRSLLGTNEPITTSKERNRDQSLQKYSFVGLSGAYRWTMTLK